MWRKQTAKCLLAVVAEEATSFDGCVWPGGGGRRYFARKSSTAAFHSSGLLTITPCGAP